ncbi:MAG: DNA (cytosine-5)-methyltransferase 1 [Myxococcota bacterium]|jgi:DNA (cytosine-5)-methyltransferase 1
MPPFDVVSLFSGCGGLDLGFQAAGGRITYACDRSEHAVRCYRHNLGEHCHQRDVTSEAFTNDIEQLDSTDVVLGGFPCQGFSKAGPKRKDDARNHLYRSMQAAVLRLKPAVFVAENVDGIQQNFGGEFVKQIRAAFQSSDVAYDVHYQVLDAAHYGVPQHRRRAFFVGVRRHSSGSPAFQWPTHTRKRRTRNGEFTLAKVPQPLPHAATDLPAPATVREAIADLEDQESAVADHRTTGRWPEKYEHVFRAIGTGQKLCNVRHASTSVYTWQIPETFGATTATQRVVLKTISKHRRRRVYGSIPNGNPIPVVEIARLTGLDPAAVAADCAVLETAGYLKPKLGGYDLKGAMFCSGLFKRPRWDEPAPTILTNFHSPRYFLHPELNRPFTLRECARMQSFKDSFEFLASGISLVEGYRLVGNAVPPKLAEAIGRSVADVVVRAKQRRVA